MQYKYGVFSKNQDRLNEQLIHSEIHKLLLYKDKLIEQNIFNSDKDFKNYFDSLLLRYGGFNTLLGEPSQMMSLMSTLQAARNQVEGDSFNWNTYRKLILDAHGFVKAIFEEVR